MDILLKNKSIFNKDLDNKDGLIIFNDNTYSTIDYNDYLKYSYYPTFLDGFTTTVQNNLIFVDIGKYFDNVEQKLFIITKPLFLNIKDVVINFTNDNKINNLIEQYLCVDMTDEPILKISNEDNITNGFTIAKILLHIKENNSFDIITVTSMSNMFSSGSIFLNTLYFDSTNKYGYKIYSDGWKQCWGYGENPTFPITFEDKPKYVSDGATDISKFNMKISKGYWYAMGY